MLHTQLVNCMVILEIDLIHGFSLDFYDFFIGLFIIKNLNGTQSKTFWNIWIFRGHALTSYFTTHNKQFRCVEHWALSPHFTTPHNTTSQITHRATHLDIACSPSNLAPFNTLKSQHIVVNSCLACDHWLLRAKTKLTCGRLRVISTAIACDALSRRLDANNSRTRTSAIVTNQQAFDWPVQCTRDYSARTA